MTPIERQMEQLRAVHPTATHERLADGSYLITIPAVRLPAGKWNKETTAIRFLAPVGYPAGRPDCFWTDRDLLLSGNRVPQNTGANPIPNYQQLATLWFSWHVSTWSPNSDSLLTYLRVIEQRLNDAR